MDDYTKALKSVEALEKFAEKPEHEPSESESKARKDVLDRLRRLLDIEDEKQRRKERKLFSLLLCKASFVDTKFLYCFDPARKAGQAAWEAYLRIAHARSFAALGSMADCIQMHELKPEKGSDDNEDLLKAVFDENNWVSSQVDGTVFVNPRYIVYSYKKGSPEERHYDGFWADPAVDNFLFVTFINASDPAATYLERKVFRRNLNDAIRRARWDVRKKYSSTYNFLIFDSLDLLTDYVVLWRAKNIRPVLEALHEICLNGVPGLGRGQTICSVPVDRLLDDVSCLDEAFDPAIGLDEKKEQYNMLKDAIDYHKSYNHAIDSMTLRAVGSDYQKLLNLKSKLSKLAEETKITLNHSFVLGNTDYIGFFKNMTDRNVCTYLRELLLILYKGDVGNALLRLETSIGLDLPEEETVKAEQSKPCQHTEKLNEAAKYLLKEMTEIFSDRDVFSEDYAPWTSSVLELCNMLVQMNRSCIYDSAAFLLLDSLYLFHAWLQQEIRVKTADDSSRPFARVTAQMRLAGETHKINKCVNGWIQLTDMITRSSGTITHMPGYSPLQYHITSSVVEITQAFYIKFARILRLCTREKMDVSCVLVPTECERISTDGYFKGKMKMLDENKVVINEMDVMDGSMLVYIEVPMEVLSQPLTIATMLAHEAGHHYGHQEISLRTARNTFFARALGRMIGDALYVGDPQNKAAINDIETCLYKEINEEYEILFSKVVGNNKATQCYCLRAWNKFIPICERKATKMLQEFMAQNTTAPDVKQKIRWLLGLTEEPYQLRNYIDQLKELFCESLCDVLMLAVLHNKCGAKELANYIRSIFTHEAELARCKDKSFTQIVQRIYVVRQVACKIPGERGDKDEPGDRKGGYKLKDPSEELPSVRDIIAEIDKKKVEGDRPQPETEAFLEALESGLADLQSANPPSELYREALNILIEYLTDCRGWIEVLFRDKDLWNDLSPKDQEKRFPKWKKSSTVSAISIRRF